MPCTYTLRSTVSKVILRMLSIRWVTDLRDSLLLAETAGAAAGGASGAEGGAAQPDVPARTAAGLEVAATLEANRKLAVINGMGDHNRAQVRRLNGLCGISGV